MSLKDLFWKGDEGEKSPEPSDDHTGEPVQSAATPRPLRRTPATDLAALRPGPSATMFERATGLPALSKQSSQPVSGVDETSDNTITECLEQDSKELGFKEFIAQFTALSGFIADKKQCTAAALAAIQATNPKLNATQVTKAIGERLQLITGYEADYDADSSKREQAETADKAAAIKEAEIRIQELKAEIARLQGEEATVASEAHRLQTELSGVTSKYSGYRSRFQAAADARREDLKQLLGFVAPGAPQQKGE